MGISLPNIIIILFIVLILFGAGKLPKVMGDLAKGIKNFKDGLKEEENPLKEDKERDQ
jgi:sec-independent protein translocase protein TatA